jgi:uncharacterized protein DUF6111
MTRFVINLLFFLLPFVTYWIFMVITRRIDHQPDREWADAPFGWLVVAGLAFGVGSMIVLGYVTGLETNDVYEPARLIDGEIQPGGMRE